MVNKIPMIDLKRQIAPIRGEIQEAIKKVIDNTDFILGKEVRDFENAVAGYCKAGFAIGVSNGTDALRLSLKAIGIESGEGVLCPAFTYYATAGAIASIGAVPVFVDIEADTYNISKGLLELTIKKHRGPKIKAITPVHLYGQCADMDGIIEIAQKYGLKVIEDTAQAFGAQYHGKIAGTLGDCGAVSFFPAKNLGAFGDAGMVLTNNEDLDKALRILRNQGNIDKYYHLVLGSNNRMDTIQAAILNVKLKYLDSWNKKRQENAAYYNQRLEGLSLRTPKLSKYSTHIYHQYVLRLPSTSAKLKDYLKDKGIDSRVYYPLPLHLQECFKYLGYKKGDFPESEKAATHTLAIPVYPDLTKEEMDYIVNSIKEFMQK